jgi:hypothetical protein
LKPIVKKVLRILAMLTLAFVAGGYVFVTKWNAAFNKRYYVRMKSAMMTLAMGQDEYFAVHGRFAAEPSQLDSMYRPSADQKVVISAADSVQWAGSVGSAAPIGTCAATGTRWTGPGKRSAESLDSLLNGAKCTDSRADAYWHRGASSR